MSNDIYQMNNRWKVYCVRLVCREVLQVEYSFII